MNRADVVRLVTYMHELWPHYGVPTDDDGWDVRTEAWLDVLGDCSAGSVRAAIAAVSSREFAPTVGQLRLMVSTAVDPTPAPEQIAREIVGYIANGALNAHLPFWRDGEVIEPTPFDERWSHPLVCATAHAMGGPTGLAELAMLSAEDLHTVVVAHIRRAAADVIDRNERTQIRRAPVLEAWRAASVPALEASNDR